jgi:hypothetical protein
VPICTKRMTGHCSRAAQSLPGTQRFDNYPCYHNHILVANGCPVGLAQLRGQPTQDIKGNIIKSLKTVKKAYWGTKRLQIHCLYLCPQIMACFTCGVSTASLLTFPSHFPTQIIKRRKKQKSRKRFLLALLNFPSRLMNNLLLLPDLLISLC